jgi:hypothetical protein
LTRPLVNGCAACGEDFASLRAFDQHTLSAASDPLFDCKQVAELQAEGWTHDDRGRWTSPTLLAKAQQTRERFEEAA